MKPHKVTFYLYAEDEAQVHQLQCSLFDLVDSLYHEGIYVTAGKLDKMLKDFGHNPLFKTLLK